MSLSYSASAVGKSKNHARQDPTSLITTCRRTTPCLYLSTLHFSSPTCLRTSGLGGIGISANVDGIVPFTTVGVVVISMACVADNSHPLSAVVVIDRVGKIASVSHGAFNILACFIFLNQNIIRSATHQRNTQRGHPPKTGLQLKSVGFRQG